MPRPSLFLTHPSLETIIRKDDELNARVSIIEAVSARDTQGVNAAWINRMTFEIFTSFTNPSYFDPHLFMPLVQRYGCSLLLNWCVYVPLSSLSLIAPSAFSQTLLGGRDAMESS